MEKEIKPQDKVAVISQNHVDYIETVLGIIMAGGVPVNINWRLAAPELHHLLQFNEVKLTFFRSKDESIRKEMGELTKEMCQCVDMDCIKEVLEGVEPLEQFIEREDEDVLMHLHTSGTTGMPKTVRYTKGQYMRELTTCVHSLGFDKDTVFQLMSQLFHSASIGPYSIFACGGTIVLFPKFSPQEYLKSIEKHHVTRLSAIPTVLTALLNQPDFDRYDLSSIHTISYSTCPMPPELIKRALKHFNCGFQQSYGMTEMGSIVTMLTEEEHIKDNMRYLNSVGRPIEDHKVKIIADDGSECAPGETGEIVVTGPGMMKDYYKMPDETKEVMVDGWYHTRDMGYLDEKEPSYDMALFGRMVASDPSLNYDAAAQVAHSISTHTIHNEYDYFTAVDDCSQEDNAGAGHLGTVEFNSFTMYRYATVNVMELYRHLGKDTAEVVEGFIKAFICSMPTGKQNTFANRTLPDAVYITVRKDQPLNLCGAFERPILSNCGYVDKSVEAMTAYAKKVYDNYADEPEKAFGIGDQLEGAAEVMSLKQLLESVKTEIQAQLDDGGEE